MKRAIRRITLLSFLFLAIGNLSSQIQITGIVTDKNGEPLVGVSILNKAEKKGTVSDINGKYGISVPNKKTTLDFSYIGFVSQSVTVGDKKQINITLAEENKFLEEIVVVGYQEVMRRDLTGSVAKADLGEMKKMTSPNITQSLAGRIAGVNVSSSEGMPGGTMNITIRGNNSLTQDNSPLYVIDGFPVEDPAAIAAFNPADIENFDILKDASATAIYGARGANGVVMITTKKGEVGQPIIGYNGTYGQQFITRKIPLMNAYEFVKLQAELFPSEMDSKYFREDPSTGKRYSLEDYRNIAQYDWQKEIFRSAPQQNHSLTITGGTPEARYNASVSFYDQDGVVLSSNFNRLQSRIGLNIRKRKLNLTINANYSRSTQNGNSPAQGGSSGMNSLFFSVWGYRPVNMPGQKLSDLIDNGLDDDVSTTNDYRFNPVMSLRNEYRKNQNIYFQNNGSAEYEIRPGLKVKISGGITSTIQHNETFNNSRTRYGSSLSVDRVNANYTSNERLTWLNENLLTWQTNIRKRHFFNLLGGVTLQHSDFKSYSLRSVQIPNEGLGMAGLSEGTPSGNSSINSEWSMMSYLGKVNYNYKSKYYLTASFRADGSSKFRSNNRFGYFPSASLGWSFTEEKFMESLKPIIESGKLRVSWGNTGNNRVGEYETYATIRILQSGGGVYTIPTGYTHGIYPFNNQINGNIGAIPFTMANKDLKWETTEQYNIGTDLSFFKERINVTIDWYHKMTKDLLLLSDLPYSSGYGSAMKNIGRVQNRGLEFTLNTTNIQTKSFKWVTNFNIAFNRNKVLELAENQETLLTNAYFDNGYTAPNYITKLGYPMGMMYGYMYEGTYKYEDFNFDGTNYTLKAGVPSFSNESKTQPGYPKLKDLNRDGVINSDDQTIIGKSEPIHIGGFTNSLTYKNIDFSIFLQWSYGNDILNANRLMFESGQNKDLNQFASYSERWSADNPTSNIPRASANSSPSSKVFSSRIIEDGSYLRLKNITIGYNFPAKTLKRAKIKSLRLFASADNLYTFTSYTGYDPEVSTRNSALTPGMDFSAYPRALSINGGVNITF